MDINIFEFFLFEDGLKVVSVLRNYQIIFGDIIEKEDIFMIIFLNCLLGCNFLCEVVWYKDG